MASRPNRESGFDDRLVELVRLRVSQINGRAHYLNLRARAPTKKEFAPEKLSRGQVRDKAGSIFYTRVPPCLGETSARVAETALSDEEFQAVSSVFSEKEVVNLMIAIGLMNIFNRTVVGFHRPLD